MESANSYKRKPQSAQGRDKSGQHYEHSPPPLEQYDNCSCQGKNHEMLGVADMVKGVFFNLSFTYQTLRIRNFISKINLDTDFCH